MPVVQAPSVKVPETPTIAEEQFRQGKCSEAVTAYTEYLRANPAALDRDLVLLRIAVCRLLPDSPVNAPDEGLRILNELVSRFPGSSWRLHAELILGLDGQARERVAEIEQSRARVQGLTEELEKARKSDTDTRADLQQLQASSAKELKDRETRIRQLNTTVEELEERIRRLSEDLEALKKIDLQRRPSRPRP